MTKQQYNNWIRDIECNECGTSEYINWFVCPETNINTLQHSRKEQK